MSSTIVTILIAFGIILIALALLGIGLLITGKSKMEAGACGRAPQDKRKKECGTKESCSLCEHNKEKLASDTPKDIDR